MQIQADKKYYLFQQIPIITMHLAYSVLQNTSQQANTVKTVEEEYYNLRYQAYQKTCVKYYQEIAAIQKRLPGWAPALPTY